MIRLIKNEMYKILHKKSTYVVLIITILLICIDECLNLLPFD